MDLLKLKIQYPERFSQTEELSFKSEIYVIPKAKGLGIIGLAELVISIFLSKEIKNRNGKPASLVQLARAFEYVFNCNFGSIYDKQAEVYNRKFCNLTKSLDFLKGSLERGRKINLLKQNEKEWFFICLNYWVLYSKLRGVVNYSPCFCIILSPTFATNQ